MNLLDPTHSLTMAVQFHLGARGVYLALRSFPTRKLILTSTPYSDVLRVVPPTHTTEPLLPKQN
jgi:hypothetical protein